MERPGNPEPIIKPDDFHSDMMINLGGTDEQELYNDMSEMMLEKTATFLSLGSGWRLHRIV